MGVLYSSGGYLLGDGVRSLLGCCCAGCPTDCSACTTSSVSLAADSTPIFTDQGCTACSGFDPWDPCDYYRFYLTIGAQTISLTQDGCYWSGVLVWNLWVQRYTDSGCASETGSPVDMGTDNGTIELACLGADPYYWGLTAGYNGLAGSAYSYLGTLAVSPCPDGTYSDGSIVS